MSENLRTVITGSGRCIPGEVYPETGEKTPGETVPNTYFKGQKFYTRDGDRVRYTEEGPNFGKIKPNLAIRQKLESITTITSRTYADKDENASDLATRAAERCFASYDVNREKIKLFICANNFGDSKKLGTKWDSVPSMASRAKHKLQIENPWVVAYDLIGSRKDLEQVVKGLTRGGRHLVLGKGIDSTNPEAVYEQAKKAMDSLGGDKETLKSIVVAHDSERLPCLAQKMKKKLGIRNPSIIAYDILFGCPGFLEGFIQADKLLKPGEEAMIAGTETLSRVSLPGDMNTMIYSDGAGVTTVKAIETEENVGMLASASRSDTLKDAYMLRMGKAYDPNYSEDNLGFEMDGNALHKRVLLRAHKIMRKPLDELGIPLREINLVLPHQANGKMDLDVLRFFLGSYGVKMKYSKQDSTHYAAASKLKEGMNSGVYAALSELCGKKDYYSIKEIASVIMPLPINWIANSSVATCPIVYDLVARGDLLPYEIKTGDIIDWVSMGGGLNFNSMVTKAA